MDQIMESNQKTTLLTSYHNAGYIPIPLNGKIPAVKNWTKATYDLEINLEDFPENFGLVLQADDLVIDVDPRNFPKDDKVFARLNKVFGIMDIADRVVVRTGSGGYHIYFKKPAEVAVRENHDTYPGIEFKSKGRQVVGAGSIHPDTGRTYELIAGDLSRVPTIPAALLDFVSTSKKAKKHEDATEKYPDRASDITAYIQYLEHAEPAIEGANGDKQTYTVACEARALHISPQKCYDLMALYFNPKCMPSWSEEELKDKVANAYKYAQGAPGEKTPEKDFAPVEGPKVEVVTWDGVGANRKKTLKNAVNCFIVGGARNPLFETLAFCEFSGRVMVQKKLPWDSASERYPRQWTDGDSTHARHFIGSYPATRIDFNKDLIGQAVYAVSRRVILHPIRDYLNGLKWDGIKRLDNWLIDYCGASDTAYTREVGKNTLIQAVARSYHPGCRADHVLILEGAQGIGKSSVVRILGGEYYADIVIDAHNRDTVDAMRGAWFIEFSEMEVTRRAEAQALKSFITRTTDRCRLAYMQFTFDYPRSCVFIGTINPDAMGEYLSDATGNRRFWPVACSIIRMDALRADRDQLFAEAVARYKKGEAYHIEDKHVLKEAQAEQEKRQTTEPWSDMIAEYLETNEMAQAHGLVVVKDIWLYGLRGSESGFTKAQAHKIGNVLRSLGYSYGAFHHPITKTTTRMFRKLEDPTHGRAQDLQLDPLFS